MKINVKCDKCDTEFKTEIADAARGYDYETHVADKHAFKYVPGKKGRKTKKGTFEEQVTCPHCGAQLHVDFNITEEEPKGCASWVCIQKSSPLPYTVTNR